MTASVEFSSKVLAAYAKKNNWRFLSEGEEGQLFFKELNGGKYFLPIPFKSSTDLLSYHSQIIRLAQSENRSEKSVIFDLQNYNRDVVRLRGASEIWNENSIPLKSGAGLLSTAYKMLRAIATTSRSPKSYIGSGFSKIGEDLISSIILGQTEPGSYVLPVIVPLTRSEDLVNHIEGPGTAQLIEFAPVAPERKVTTSLAHALNAIEKLIIKPLKLPNVDDELKLIESGVSHELLVSISSFLTHPSVQNLDISFSWAYGIDEPSGVTTEVRFENDSAQALDEVALRLKKKPPLNREIVAGEIVTLHRPIEADANYVVLATVRNGRMSRIYVDLNNEQFEAALTYAKQHRSVIVEGDIISSFGKPPRIVSPTRFLAVDETVLPL